MVASFRSDTTSHTPPVDLSRLVQSHKVGGDKGLRHGAQDWLKSRLGATVPTTGLAGLRIRVMRLLSLRAKTNATDSLVVKINL